MRLRLHPDSRCEAVIAIEVEAERSPGGLLALRYVVRGELGLPPHRPSARADELWRHTCFEAFVRTPSDPGYYEFNLAPSSEWAAYRFEGYREGMRPADAIAAPRIETTPTDGGFELRALLDPPVDGPWRVGLSAVIEEAGGRISYWALAHPAGKPDFHHPDCFALELPATGRS